MTESPKPQTTPWPVILALIAAGVMVAFQVGKAPAALPVLQQDLGIGLVTAGWVVSIFNMVAMLAGAAVGVACDRFGHRGGVVLGLVVAATASGVGAAADGAVLLLATRAVEGFGLILVAVSVPPLLARLASDRDRPMVVGLWGTFMPIGMALVMLAAPPVLAAGGWRSLWLANAGLLLLAGAALWLVVARLPGRSVAAKAAARTGAWAGFRRTATAAGPVTLGLIFGTYALQYLSLVSFLPLMMVSEGGYGVGFSAVATALVAAANALGNVIGAWLLHRRWQPWFLCLAASVLMGVLAPVVYADGLADGVRFSAALAFSLFGGLIPSSLFAAAARLAPSPDLIGATNGLLMQGSNTGQMLGPPALAALVAAAGGWHVAPWFLALFAAATVALSLRLRWLEKRGG